MSLGDYVRVCRKFVEAFKWAEAEGKPEPGSGFTSGSEEEEEDVIRKRIEQVTALRRDIKSYQDQLSRLGIKDDRVRRPIRRLAILKRILIRALWAFVLFALSLPGFILWSPVLLTTRYYTSLHTRTGPVWDTYDEIAQLKLVYGLASGCLVWVLCVVATFPIAPITIFLVPALMWMTLRWLEDGVSACRALMALTRLLWVGKPTLRKLYLQREDLHARLIVLATQYLGLPSKPEVYFAEVGGHEKGRVRGSWDSKMQYFSIRRRRKRDWNETLRLYDQVDYPEDNLI
jgi:glycerol-3-phosphate O-acyltransferase/dihydroxyacetone phosphate acyltransferase